MKKVSFKNMWTFNNLKSRNPILAYLGLFFIVLSVLLLAYLPFNHTEVLGVNSMIKPLKFALSSWIYAWTMAYVLSYVNNQRAVHWYSILAVVVFLYENGVITVQALRGTLSHFNQQDLVSGVLYGFMGVMIVWLTSATLVLTIRFIRQETYTISSEKALSIKLGLILFVIFSFFGGVMSAFNTHTIGEAMGGAGLPMVNWSTTHGDLRVAHFFGIHALQAIPLFGFWVAPKFKTQKTAIWVFSIIYTLFVVAQAWAAFNGNPFISL